MRTAPPLLALVITSLPLAAQVDETEPVVLPEVMVVSDRVANQEPASTFAMPVTALAYEPLVDAQGRNLIEAQADVSIRGGTFENTGFSIGALPIYDPQTGHYFAELPISAAMLGTPEIRTGFEQAAMGWGSTAGGVAYGWRPVRSGGFVSGTLGENQTVAGELYAGYESPAKLAGRTVAADVSVAASDGNADRRFGFQQFERYNARVQLRDETAQTDVFGGYQDKKFGWPNLYAASSPATPDRAEIEDLMTRLAGVNHRVRIGADGDYFQAGAYYRDNDDHYSIPIFPFNAFHTTIVRGAGLDGRVSLCDTTALRYRAGVVDDDLDSTTLTFGSYSTRVQYYAGLFADHTIALSDERDLVLTAGANYDDSDREDDAVSPVAEVALKSDRGPLDKLYVSYAESTQLPTYTALNSNPAAGLFRGNPDLGRSTARNLELGAEATVAQWTAHAAVFFRRDDDLVDWTYSGATPNARTANAVDIDTLGFELFARRAFARVDLILGYTYLDKDDDYGAGVDASFYALNYAEHRLTAAVVARLGGGFEVRMDNEARIQTENALRRRNDEVVLSALGLYYHVPRVKGLTLSARVDNLWNTYYEEVPLVPGTPRYASLGASYAF